MSHPSITLLTQHLKAQLERLAVLQEYHSAIDDAYVTVALAFMIEDTQEAIARVSSRLRRLGQAPGQAPDQAGDKLLRQARSRRSLPDKLKFIRHGLKHQLQWYETHLKDLAGDADTQAILVGLAEQTRMRLERWDTLMKDLKVSPD